MGHDYEELVVASFAIDDTSRLGLTALAVAVAVFVLSRKGQGRAVESGRGQEDEAAT